MHFFWHLPLLTSILPFLAQFTIPYALPRHDSLTRRANHQGTLQVSTTAASADKDLANTTQSLLPRTLVEEVGFQSFIRLGGGWNLYYSSTHAASLPIQPAAWDLTKLYATMLVQAQTTWRKGPPMSVIPLVIGQIELIMICPDKPIPWQLVETFASEMLRITGEGWTGLYQVLLSHAAEDVSIGIQLNVLSGGVKRPRPWS